MVRQSTKLVLTGFLSFFLFSGCAEDNPVSTADSQAENQKNASITVRILDIESNEPVKDAKVRVYGAETITTDNDGMAKWSSMESGSYIVSAEKPGYETVESKLSFKTFAINQYSTITENAFKTIYLCKRDAVLKGYVYCQVSSTKIQPASNATLKVIIQHSYDSTSFKNPVRTISTNEKGLFIIDSLPRGADYSVVPELYTMSSQVYLPRQEYSSYGSLAIKDTTHCSTITLLKRIQNDFLMLSNNSDSITVRDPLKIVFSENLNREAITSDSIVVTTYTQTSPYYGSSNQTVLTSYTITDNSLEVYPFNGIWTKNKNYTLRIYNLKSTTGNKISSLEIPFTINDKGILPNIDIIRVSTEYSDTSIFDYNSTIARVYWKPLSTVSEYTVFTRSSKDSNWVSQVTSSGEYTTVSFPSGSLGYGGRIDFMVLAKNGQSYYNNGNAKIISIRDNTSPRISNNSYYNTITGTQNSSGTKELTIKTSYQSFPEPMDTTIIPTIVVNEGGSTYESGDSTFKIANPVWKWITPTKAEIIIKVPAGKNGTNDTIAINFSKCKDSSGNLAISDNTGSEPLLTFTTR